MLGISQTKQFKALKIQTSFNNEKFSVHYALVMFIDLAVSP